ncbi:MAG: pilus assembly protein PilP [Deltaproteobacteria bacterium]|nr:pilus assembly protein PilP [Deltaproteobacteria bacterium]
MKASFFRFFFLRGAGVYFLIGIISLCQLGELKAKENLIVDQAESGKSNLPIKKTKTATGLNQTNRLSTTNPEYIYDPTGKPDPFKPFILETNRPKEIAGKPLHPLQRYDISQLKLVGIICKADNPRALLEDAAGKGYIVVRGSYVGKKDGRISDILENEVIITEKSTNIFGETEIKEIRVKLHE